MYNETLNLVCFSRLIMKFHIPCCFKIKRYTNSTKKHIQTCTNNVLYSLKHMTHGIRRCRANLQVTQSRGTAINLLLLAHYVKVISTHTHAQTYLNKYLNIHLHTCTYRYIRVPTHPHIYTPSERIA